jgi:hypothetical protein
VAMNYGRYRSSGRSRYRPTPIRSSSGSRKLLAAPQPVSFRRDDGVFFAANNTKKKRRSGSSWNGAFGFD